MTTNSSPQAFWSIGKKLAAGFLAILALLLVISVLSLNRFGYLTDSIRNIVEVEWKKTAAVTTISDGGQCQHHCNHAAGLGLSGAAPATASTHC